MDQDLLRFFAEARRFEDDKVILAQKSEQKAWRVATAACVLAGLSTLTIMFLLPLKETRVEAVVLDKASGTWQPMQTLDTVQVTLDEVFHRHFITMFMLARENYTFETAEMNYYTAAAFMSPKLQAEWGELWDDKNPNNPMNVHKKTGTVKIQIASITLKKKEDGTMEVATVRFTKSTEPERFWVATISYKFVDTPAKEEERRINPIGFQVVDYTVDPEVAGRRPVSQLRAPQ